MHLVEVMVTDTGEAQAAEEQTVMMHRLVVTQVMLVVGAVVMVPVAVTEIVAEDTVPLAQQVDTEIPTVLQPVLLADVAPTIQRILRCHSKELEEGKFLHKYFFLHYCQKNTPIKNIIQRMRTTFMVLFEYFIFLLIKFSDRLFFIVLIL